MNDNNKQREQQSNKKYTGNRSGMTDNWLTKSTSSIVGITLVMSFLVYIFISSFKIYYNGAEIAVRTEIFNTVFMAFYGLITMYAGYLWGASKPQKDALALLQNPKHSDILTNKVKLEVANEFTAKYGSDWGLDPAKVTEFEEIVYNRTHSISNEEQALQ